MLAIKSVYTEKKKSTTRADTHRSLYSVIELELKGKLWD